jgi:ABC-type cobalamin/Fe3+-siderophores transport system ATPase subunit
VLTDINAVFAKGKVNQIIGKSGSGKSVLAKCIVGLHKPEEGKVLYEGRSFHDMEAGGEDARSDRRSGCSSKAVLCSTASPCWRT